VVFGSPAGRFLEGRALLVNEDRPAEDERPPDQVGREREGESLDELRIERDELLREREYERRRAEARLAEVLQRANAAEARGAELDEFRRERADERRQMGAALDEAIRRAEEAEARVAELQAELGKGIPGLLRTVCQAARSKFQPHWPGAGSR
jgi:DNA repair exonuclease SbcCD ATPase subunit